MSGRHTANITASSRKTSTYPIMAACCWIMPKSPAAACLVAVTEAAAGLKAEGHRSTTAIFPFRSALRAAVDLSMSLRAARRAFGRAEDIFRLSFAELECRPDGAHPFSFCYLGLPHPG